MLIRNTLEYEGRVQAALLYDTDSDDETAANEEDVSKTRELSSRMMSGSMSTNSVASLAAAALANNVEETKDKDTVRMQHQHSFSAAGVARLRRAIGATSEFVVDNAPGLKSAVKPAIHRCNK